ncbi:MAG: maleate cis-trans isomerase family protein [Candidatus Binatia bacterium]
MYGWRARIGHVAPSRGDTLVYEFYKIFSEGFMILNTTGTVRQLVDGDFEKQLARIEEAVQDLVENHCDSIIFSGSPLFTRLPFGSDRQLGKKLSDKFGVPVAAGLTAEVEALKAMNCQKLVVGTPYPEELNDRLKHHLEASGFEVLQIAGYGVRKNADLTDLPVHASYKIATRLYAKGRNADGVFIACPRWPTLPDVELLEQEIKKPVVTSSLACIWYAMKLIDVRENVRGYGRLMASLA